MFVNRATSSSGLLINFLYFLKFLFLMFLWDLNPTSAVESMVNVSLRCLCQVNKVWTWRKHEMKWNETVLSFSVHPRSSSDIRQLITMKFIDCIPETVSSSTASTAVFKVAAYLADHQDSHRDPREKRLIENKSFQPEVFKWRLRTTSSRPLSTDTRHVGRHRHPDRQLEDPQLSQPTSRFTIICDFKKI